MAVLFYFLDSVFYWIYTPVDGYKINTKYKYKRFLVLTQPSSPSYLRILVLALRLLGYFLIKLDTVKTNLCCH